jgi:CheY-like chemotaxis protein
MNATTSTTRTPKALLLDDDVTVLRLLGTALEARGVDLRAATDGESGLALLLDELLDLDVLAVDLDLPGRNAWELLRLVRRAGGERDLRVVVLASALDRGVRDALLALGADAVVDRRAGHAAAAEAISALARGGSPPARRPEETPRAALAGVLVLARAALVPLPAPRLAASPA